MQLERFITSELEFVVWEIDGYKMWPYFAEYHYLSDTYKGHRAFLAVIDDSPVAFSSIMRYPSGTVKNAWREHRTVVIPQFQGLGLGARMSDWTAHYVCDTLTEGQGRYFSKTVHPRLGEYRERSPLWKPTSKNKKGRSAKEAAETYRDHSVVTRVSYSHEYIGHLHAKESGQDTEDLSLRS